MRIRERTKEAMLKKKMEKLEALGMTLEEYELSRKAVKKEKRAAQKKGGLTEEGRKRISESMKLRWQQPDFKSNYSATMKGNRNHSEETKVKISAAIRRKWEEEEYRTKFVSSSPSEEVRAKISATLKAKWHDPEFRERMVQSMGPRDEDWKSKVSSKIKLLWENGTYRSSVVKGIKAAANRTRVSSNRRKSSSKRSTKPALSAEEKARRSIALREEKLAKELLKRETLQKAKKSQKDAENKQSLKELLGKELWFEEKVFNLSFYCPMDHLTFVGFCR